ncbi:CDP-glycerol:poly(glycerophosphate) glycerophosphotransferase, partial [Staphylococcus epidermidis FS1]
HQVVLKNKAMVRQYKKVYDATDYYLVGGEKMAQCFIQSFDASPSQMLKFGLPRLTQYFRSNLKLEQQRLKKKYHITNKLAVYVPTYREGQVAQRTIDKENFERHLPNYTLLSHLHPSTVDCQTSHSIDVTSLLIMADIIISDYSSLPIEASALNKPTLIYNYDEQQYEKVRGLNEFYYAIPERYKMSNEEAIIQAIQDNDEQFQSLFNDWHQYNSKDSLNQLVHFINKLVK